MWADWLKLRAAKKAPVTETVLASAKREAAKAGLSLEQFLTIWCARGSQGLQAEWIKPNEGQTVGQSDNKPDWAINAGFSNRWEAENEGCREHNAHLFSNGKRTEVA